MDLKRLREIAQKGTPGFWPERFWIGGLETPDGKRAMIFGHGPPHRYREEGNDQAISDAEHIAAFRPGVALELLDTIERYEKALEEERLVEAIYKWKFSWMNVTGTDERDRQNYFNRAFGVDANMIHDLARIITREIRERIGAT